MRDNTCKHGDDKYTCDLCNDDPKPEAPTDATLPLRRMLKKAVDLYSPEPPKSEAPTCDCFLPVRGGSTHDFNCAVLSRPEPTPTQARPDLSKTQRGLLNAINEFNPPKPEPTPAQAPSLGSELVGALREANAGHDAQAPGAREFLFYKNEPVDGSVNGRMCCEVNPAKWDDPKWTEDYRTLRLIEYAAYGALERELSKAQERAAFYKSCARSGENPDDWGKGE